jgi:hypothetical protein
MGKKDPPNWLLKELSDGTTISVASIAGKDCKRGALGALTLQKDTPDGKTMFRKFEATGVWYEIGRKK